VTAIFNAARAEEFLAGPCHERERGRQYGMRGSEGLTGEKGRREEGEDARGRRRQGDMDSTPQPLPMPLTPLLLGRNAGWSGRAADVCGGLH
jgi:hypothetical protein